MFTVSSLWRCSPFTLFSFVFPLVISLEPFFFFHDMPFLKFDRNSLWTTHCIHTVIKSLGELASWPQETTFRNLEWTLGCRGFRYIGIQRYADRQRAVPPFWRSPSRESKNSLKKKIDVSASREAFGWRRCAAGAPRVRQSKSKGYGLSPRV